MKDSRNSAVLINKYKTSRRGRRKIYVTNQWKSCSCKQTKSSFEWTLRNVDKKTTSMGKCSVFRFIIVNFLSFSRDKVSFCVWKVWGEDHDFLGRISEFCHLCSGREISLIWCRLLLARYECALGASLIPLFPFHHQQKTSNIKRRKLEAYYKNEAKFLFCTIYVENNWTTHNNRRRHIIKGAR